MARPTSPRQDRNQRKRRIFDVTKALLQAGTLNKKTEKRHNEMGSSGNKIQIAKIYENSIKATNSHIEHGPEVHPFPTKEQNNKIRGNDENNKPQTSNKPHFGKTLFKGRLERLLRNKPDTERQSTEIRNTGKNVMKMKRYVYSDYYVWDDRVQSNYDYGEYEHINVEDDRGSWLNRWNNDYRHYTIAGLVLLNLFLCCCCVTCHVVVVICRQSCRGVTDTFGSIMDTLRFRDKNYRNFCKLMRSLSLPAPTYRQYMDMKTTYGAEDKSGVGANFRFK